MSKVVAISPENTPLAKGNAARPDTLARLEKLEDFFLSALQEIRAIKSELTKRDDPGPALEKLLDAKVVASILGETERQVYQLAKKKAIPSIRLGKYWKFSPAELQKWLESQGSV